MPLTPMARKDPNAPLPMPPPMTGARVAARIEELHFPSLGTVEPILEKACCTPIEKSSWARRAACGCDELSLLLGGEARVLIGSRDLELGDGTLVFSRRGESCGCSEGAAASAAWLWSIGFLAGAKTYAGLSGFLEREPQKRVWRLSAEQISEFKSVFVKIGAEATTHQTGDGIAESAWLRLLFVMVQRWSESGEPARISAKPVDEELVRLWKRVTELVHVAHSEEQLRDHLPNYDSLRHRFQKVFGVSPQKMLVSMRAEAAKALLLESSLSIKEISERLGYARQHEFCRAFKKTVGMSPTQWKANPLAVP